MASIVLRVDLFEKLGLIESRYESHWYKLSKMTELPPVDASIWIASDFHLDISEIEWNEERGVYFVALDCFAVPEQLENVKSDLQVCGFGMTFPDIEIHDRKLDAISSNQIVELIQAVRTLAKVAESSNRCF